MASPIYTLVSADQFQNITFFTGTTEYIVRQWEVPAMDDPLLAAFPNLEFRINFVCLVDVMAVANLKIRLGGTVDGVNGTVVYTQDITSATVNYKHFASGAITVANPNQPINVIKIGVVAEQSNLFDNITILIRGVA